MGKRSKYPRQALDNYPTPAAAVVPLLPHLVGIRRFAEPCAGHGDLVGHLTAHGFTCVYSADIMNGDDALFLNEDDVADADAIITNPPWDRDVLHPLLNRFMQLRPTWILLDSDWAHTKQAGAYLLDCAAIVSVGRVRWMPGTKNDGKDNSAWYKFDRRHTGGTRFFGRGCEVPA